MTLDHSRYDLSRFVDAQAGSFDTALREIRNAHKVSHWMWFIFPQIAGLGHSEISRKFAICSIGEARAFLGHPTLGPRLSLITSAALEHTNKTAEEIFRNDAKKFLSSMTLFSRASEGEGLFHQAISQFFNGFEDRRSIQILDSLGG